MMSNTTPINVRGIDHVVIRSRAIDKMLRFYGEVLGCKVERKVDEIGMTQLRAGSALIDLVDTEGVLGRKGGPAPGPNAHNMDHLCLLIEPWDSDRISAHLTEHGVTVGAVETRYGALGIGPSIYIEDPDGNVIELKGPPG